MSRRESGGDDAERGSGRLWDRVRSVTRSLTEDADRATDEESEANEESFEELLSVERPFSRETVLARTGMTPEECVLELVERRDGRMRQSAVVEVTGWSPATVSRILSDMEDAGSIVRFRLGPGKVVFLPEHAPEGVAAP